jgi:hypothetical protein
MSLEEAERIINLYGKELAKSAATAKDTVVLHESSLPCSKGRIKQAYFTYISELLKVNPKYIRENLQQLIGAYSQLNNFVNDNEAKMLESAKKYTYSPGSKDTSIMSAWTKYVSKCLNGDDELKDEIITFIREEIHNYK